MKGRDGKMFRKIFICLLTICAALFYPFQVSAAGQQIVTLQGGYQKWEKSWFEKQLGMGIQQMWVTSIPKGCVLYLDGQRLTANTALDEKKIGEVWMFTAERTAAIGVIVQKAVSNESSQPRLPVIRCINPRF